MKIIAVLCASATLTATPATVIATKNKLLGKKTTLKSEDDENCSEKKTIKSLINCLKKACKLGNTQYALEKIEEYILKLSKFENFYEMESDVAKTINFAIQKNCFNEMRDDSHYKATENVLKYVCLTSKKTANILDICANNANAQKLVAISIKNWIDHAYVDLYALNEKIADKLELKLRKILAKCSKNHDAKKSVAKAIADLASLNVAPCTCRECKQSPFKQAGFYFDFRLQKKTTENTWQNCDFGSWSNFFYFGEKNENDFFKDIEINFDEVKCEIECNGETDLKNILTECFENKEARKYVILAIKKLIKQRYLNFFRDNFERKLKIISEICDMFEKCAEDEDSKPIVASAISELVNSDYVNDLTENNINKIIDLLSKCSNNVAALRDVSSSVHALAHAFGRIYDNDSYDERVKSDNESDFNDLLDINKSNPIDDLYDKHLIDLKNINNSIKTNNPKSKDFSFKSEEIANNTKNDKPEDDGKNFKIDLNKDFTNDNLSNTFNLLYTCINNSNLTGYYCASSIQQLLCIKNFQDMVKNDGEIKNKIVKSLSKCWSLETYDEPTHDIIEDIINRYRKKFFSDSDIKEIKTDKTIDWNIESENSSSDILPNSDEEIEETEDEKSVNQNTGDKHSYDEEI